MGGKILQEVQIALNIKLSELSWIIGQNSLLELGCCGNVHSVERESKQTLECFPFGQSPPQKPQICRKLKNFHLP